MDLGAFIGILSAVIGCFVGLAGWLSGRDKSIKNDSEWKGIVNTKLDLVIGLRADFTELSETVDEHGKDIAVMKRDISTINRKVDKIEGGK